MAYKLFKHLIGNNNSNKIIFVLNQQWDHILLLELISTKHEPVLYIVLPSIGPNSRVRLRFM